MFTALGSCGLTFIWNTIENKATCTWISCCLWWCLIWRTWWSWWAWWGWWRLWSGWGWWDWWDTTISIPWLTCLTSWAFIIIISWESSIAYTRYTIKVSISRTIRNSNSNNFTNSISFGISSVAGTINSIEIRIFSTSFYFYTSWINELSSINANTGF